MTDKPGYENGGAFWRDNAANYGIEEALTICVSYLSTQRRQEISDEERQFCREMFDAAVIATSGKANIDRMVYPYDFQTAEHRFDTALYHNSLKRNIECAKAIDDSIHDSHYKPDHYHLDLVAMKAILEYGFDRVNIVLARNINQHDYDGRYSRANKSWAASVVVPEGTAFERVNMNAHPILLDSCTNYARRFTEELNAARLVIPGREMSGGGVAGYEIILAVAFNDKRGFAIGHNPEAVNHYVVWQFTAESGKTPDVYWGFYADTEQAATDNYKLRAAIHCNGANVREVDPSRFGADSPLVNAETETEQNYNMVDGVINNMPPEPTPDVVTREEMNAYGYLWDSMEPLSREAALELFDSDHSVLLLYPDNTESYAESRAAIENFDGMFGREITAQVTKAEYDAERAVASASIVSRAKEVTEKPATERADGYTSVLAAIEKGKTTPKPPPKTKAQTKTKTKGGEEL